MVNQAEYIARSLGHYSTFECKYGGRSVNHLMPIVRKQANAFLAAPRVRGERFHYFDTGIKRLIIELELDDVASSWCTCRSSSAIASTSCATSRSGAQDRQAGHRGRRFQHLLGHHEIYLFMQAAGLRSANPRGLPSYPEPQPAHGAGFHPAQRAASR